MAGGKVVNEEFRWFLMVLLDDERFVGDGDGSELDLGNRTLSDIFGGTTRCFIIEGDQRLW